MQFLKLSYELITDKNITSNEFRIYTYLMSLYNEKQGCSFPPIEVIAERTTISIATVKRSIKKLVELGYVVVEKQKAKIGNFNKYTNFKHLVSDKKSVVKTEKTDVKKRTPVDSNGEVPVEGQIHISEVIEEVEKVEIMTTEARKEYDQLNNDSVRIARKYTDVEGNGYAISILACLNAEIVREAGYRFKNQLELGKLKLNCVSNFLRVVVDKYFEKGIDFPTKVFNMLKKYNYVTCQPSDAKLAMISEESEMYMQLEESSEEYVERINRELGLSDKIVGGTECVIGDMTEALQFNGIMIGANIVA